MKKLADIFINNLPILTISALGIICYYNSFTVPFQFDDLPYIVKNRNIRDINDLSAIWQSLAHPSRFVAFFTFALNYHFFKYEVFGYHLTNLLIHISSGILVYALIQLLCQTPSLKGKYPLAQAKAIALLTALLFIAHPLQTQAVTYIVQRFASLATFFYLLSLWGYLIARLKSRKGYYAVFILAGILALFTKQIAFTLPLMIICIEVFFFDAFNFFKKQKWVLVVLIVFLAVVPSFSHFSLEKVFGMQVSSGNYEGDIITAPKYFLTQFRVIPTYLRLFVFPVNQSIDYQFPLSRSFFEAKTLAGFLFLLFLFGLGVFLFKRNRLLSFGFFWFFLTISVESSIIPIHHVIYEHRCYLPSVGVFLVFSLLINQYITFKRLRYGLIVIMIGVLGFLTVKRNVVWQDKILLWQNALKTAPGQFKVHDNLGYEYWKSEQYDKALEHFNKAIAINPAYPGVYNNRGGMYADEGKHELAIKDFKRALSLRPNYVEPFYNLGKVYYDMEQLNTALSYYSKAIAIDQTYAEAFNNRGNVYGEMERYQEALEDFNSALQYEQKAHTYYHRAFTYKKMGNIAAAIADYTQAIELDPAYAEAYNNRGNIYMQKRLFDKALADYSNAIKADETLTKAYYSRGLIYKEKMALAEAYHDFSRVIELDEENAGAYFQRSLILSAMRENKKAIEDAYKSRDLGYNLEEKYLNYLKSQMP